MIQSSSPELWVNKLGHGATAAQRPLEPFILVRIRMPQPDLENRVQLFVPKEVFLNEFGFIRRNACKTKFYLTALR